MSLEIDKLLEGSIQRMADVYRYSSVPVIHRESVAQHSFFVAMYSFLIGHDVQSRGYSVDFRKLLSRALVHDLDESMTGDFLRYVKYGHPDLKRALDEVSARMLAQIEGELHTRGITPSWVDAKANDIEGSIVSVADLAQVASYAWREYSLGNQFMLDILEECRGYLSRVALSKALSEIVGCYVEATVRWIDRKLAEADHG